MMDLAGTGNWRQSHADQGVLCRGIASKYNMPLELAMSLTALALYDTVIYVDDSGELTLHA